MNWFTTVKKAGLGFITFIVAYLASNPEVITQLIPDNIKNLTIGGAIAAILVSIANYLKHKDDK